MVGLHAISLGAAFLYLKYVVRCANVGIFMNDFYKYDFKFALNEKNENKKIFNSCEYNKLS